ncbi:MAG TPA: autotransporter outer membrane beta-barrel domain-containing protein [Candidatus Helicobacter avistercoris]|nr:autotransporter outer membrane beta-barrel domain-containing protein [Candidatus Helicobacter avistercoris]
MAESIKNSNNNLLAVNFVNTMMQGYNNTPIELLNEVKSNLSMSASISSFLRNDLHTSLALASRFASFSFAPKVSQANSLQTQAFLDNDLDPKESVSSFSPNLSNSLWANAFGGANLLGGNLGASYGLNLGYDKNLENALVGTYLSYEYATLAPSLLTLNAHNIKLGVYSRIQEGGNEIDVELSSLLSIISQESATKALDSKSSADYLSSLTELKTTYGYALLEGDFKLKPLVGLALSFSYTPGFKEEGDIIKDFSSFNNFNTSLQAGLEFRANFSNKGFLYTLLSIEQDLYNSLDSLSINSQSLPITQDLKTYTQVLLGGEIAISKDWNIALSLGAKQSIVGAKDAEDKTINETYISGSVGVGYRF